MLIRPACAGVCVPVTAIGSMQLHPLGVLAIVGDGPGLDAARAGSAAAVALGVLPIVGDGPRRCWVLPGGPAGRGDRPAIRARGGL